MGYLEDGEDIVIWKGSMEKFGGVKNRGRGETFKTGNSYLKARVMGCGRKRVGLTRKTSREACGERLRLVAEYCGYVNKKCGG